MIGSDQLAIAITAILLAAVALGCVLHWIWIRLGHGPRTAEDRLHDLAERLHAADHAREEAEAALAEATERHATTEAALRAELETSATAHHDALAELEGRLSAELREARHDHETAMEGLRLARQQIHALETALAEAEGAVRPDPDPAKSSGAPEEPPAEGQSTAPRPALFSDAMSGPAPGTDTGTPAQDPEPRSGETTPAASATEAPAGKDADAAPGTEEPADKRVDKAPDAKEPADKSGEQNLAAEPATAEGTDPSPATASGDGDDPDEPDPADKPKRPSNRRGTRGGRNRRRRS